MVPKYGSAQGDHNKYDCTCSLIGLCFGHVNQKCFHHNYIFYSGWLHSSVGRALHWHCKGDGFNSHLGQILVWANTDKLSQLLKKLLHNCDNHIFHANLYAAALNLNYQSFCFSMPIKMKQLCKMSCW